MTEKIHIPTAISNEEWITHLEVLPRDEQFKHVLGNVKAYADEHGLSAAEIREVFNAGVVAARILWTAKKSARL